MEGTSYSRVIVTREDMALFDKIMLDINKEVWGINEWVELNSQKLNRHLF